MDKWIDRLVKDNSQTRDPNAAAAKPEPKPNGRLLSLASARKFLRSTNTDEETGNAQ
jgi:hypothetical protein